MQKLGSVSLGTVTGRQGVVCCGRVRVTSPPSHVPVLLSPLRISSRIPFRIVKQKKSCLLHFPCPHSQGSGLGLSLMQRRSLLHLHLHPMSHVICSSCKEVSYPIKSIYTRTLNLELNFKVSMPMSVYVCVCVWGGRGGVGTWILIIIIPNHRVRRLHFGCGDMQVPTFH